MSGPICPVCKHKWWGPAQYFGRHVETCMRTVARNCPRCDGSLVRVHKAEDRLTVVECQRESCEFQLELFQGGKP